jgi:hypothetical protein
MSRIGNPSKSGQISVNQLRIRSISAKNSRVRHANRSMQGTRRCKHQCNETSGGCVNGSGSHDWMREGGSLRRHEKSVKKHPHCTPACTGYIWLPEADSNHRSTRSAGNEDEDDDEDVGEEAMRVDRAQLTRKYRVLVVMDPTRLLLKCPKPQEFTEWMHIDLDGGQRYLDDEALRGMIFLNRSRRPKDLRPLNDGEIPVALHEKVCD